MTCCILEKQITTTVIPGSPGIPATPGSPARPAYCATQPVNVCEWIPNPALTYRWELVPPYFDGVRWIPAHYENVPYVNGVRLYNQGGVPSVVWSCHTNYVTTCYPAQAAVPGNPGTPPTPSQIITSRNLGWNSHARAISQLDPDNRLIFTVNAGAYGVFVGLGESGMEGMTITAFRHGLMIDNSGVHVFEFGTLVHQLAASHTSLTEFNIERRLDGTVVYRADAAEYASAQPSSGTLYPYAYMYSGGDRILCASYAAVGIDGEIDMTLPAMVMLMMEDADYSAINVMLPAMTCAITDYSGSVEDLIVTLSAMTVMITEMADYSAINVMLPAMTCAFSENGYTPPTPDSLYMNLPPIAVFMLDSSGESDDMAITLPAMVMLMTEEADYSAINVMLPAMSGYITEGERLDMTMVSGMFGLSPMDMARDLVITLMSGGSMVSMQTMDLIMLQSYMSDLQAASIQTMLGTYGLEYLSDVSVQSVQLMTLPTGASLNNLGRVWVVNLDTNAASQYDGYAFNSFFTRDGRQYGVADDGIYLLEGDDDAGDAIQAVAELGLSNLGDSRHKSVPSIYLGVASAGKMLVKVVADGEAHVYEARSSSVDLKNHRVDTGRGLKGANWSFTVLNQDGGDFDLSSIEFLPLFMKRRI